MESKTSYLGTLGYCSSSHPSIFQSNPVRHCWEVDLYMIAGVLGRHRRTTGSSHPTLPRQTSYRELILKSSDVNMHP